MLKESRSNPATDFKTVVQKRHKQSLIKLTERYRIYQIKNKGTFTPYYAQTTRVSRTHYNFPLSTVGTYKDQTVQIGPHVAKGSISVISWRTCEESHYVHTNYFRYKGSFNSRAISLHPIRKTFTKFIIYIQRQLWWEGIRKSVELHSI
jgi:hypothetical protein